MSLLTTLFGKKHLKHDDEQTIPSPCSNEEPNVESATSQNVMPQPSSKSTSEEPSNMNREQVVSNENTPVLSEHLSDSTSVNNSENLNSLPDASDKTVCSGVSDIEIHSISHQPAHDGKESLPTPDSDVRESDVVQPENKQHITEESDVQTMVFRRFLHMEAAFQHQVVSLRKPITIPRCTSGKMLTFREILNLLYDNSASRYHGKAILMMKNGQSVATDTTIQAEQVLDYSPFYFLFQRNADNTSRVIDNTVTISLKSEGEDGNPCYTCIVVKPFGSTKHSVYARVSIMMPHDGVDDLRTNFSKSLPHSFSMMMVYDILDPHENLQRYDAIMKSALKKVEEKSILNQDEEECMRGMSGINSPGYNMGFGKWLFEQNRIYDAYVTFQRVYNCIKPELPHIEKEFQDMFYAACHAMGICMMRLGFLDKASYYLQLAIVGGEQYIGPYVDSLALASHNRVYYFLNQVRGQAAHSESAARESQRLEQVVKTAEDNYRVPEHFDAGTLSLGYVLRHLYDVDAHCLSSASIYTTSNEQSRLVNGSEEVWKLNLLDLKESLVYIRYTRAGEEMGIKEDASRLCANNCILLNVRPVISCKGENSVRVDVMVPHFSQNDEKLYPGPLNLPVTNSFVIGAESQREEYSLKDLQTVYDISIKRMNQFRIFEAMSGFEYVHNALKIEYTKASATDSMEDLFFEATCQLGFCLVELGLYERATYYLDWAQEGGRADYAREYVNCLSNNMDIRSLEIINNLLSNLQKPDDADFEESYQQFNAFLLQRKSFVLLNRGDIQEARTLLEQLKTNALLKEYAENQLNYLKEVQQ